MDTTVKSLLSGILSTVREQQEELGDLQVSFDAAIAALKSLNPKFESAYEDALRGPDAAAAKASNARRLSLIQFAIDQLNGSPTL